MQEQEKEVKKVKLPSEKEILANLEAINLLSNPIEMNKQLVEQVKYLAKILGAFYRELKNFEDSTYQAVVQNSMEGNACIHALMKRGVLTSTELDSAFKEVSEQVRKEQEEKQHKECKHETEETGDAARPGVPAAGAELRGDTPEA